MEGILPGICDFFALCWVQRMYGFAITLNEHIQAQARGV
jgi:hypothetical protein